jgi:putative endonuclease
MASATRVLYTGVTRDLVRRVGQHRAGLVPRFTRKYRVTKLVWFEVHQSPVTAILREKQIKAGNRHSKLGLIEAINPVWNDLWRTL